MADVVLKKEEERKALENKNKELLDKNMKLIKKLSRQFPMQGAIHLIWDMIITEDVKIRSYLNYILEKEMVINAAKQSCTTIKEALNKNLVDTTKHTISFLNTLSEEYLRIMGIT